MQYFENSNLNAILWDKKRLGWQIQVKLAENSCFKAPISPQKHKTMIDKI